MNQSVRIACLMTCPRYVNTYARNHIDRAVHDAGLRLMCSLGVYYGQCMQTMMESVVDSTDLIVTIDSDSIFTAEHITRLLSRTLAHDDIGALCSMQARRGMAYPLFTVGAKTTFELTITTDPFKVVTGHFGLTAIKSEALKKTARPWFFGQPGENGSWVLGTGKIDDDIWFWKQFNEAGNVAAVDPTVRIGHMEEMVSYYDEKMQLKTVYPADLAEGIKVKQDDSETVETVEAETSGICVHEHAEECCETVNQ